MKYEVEVKYDNFTFVLEADNSADALLKVKEDLRDFKPGYSTSIKEIKQRKRVEPIMDCFGKRLKV